MQNMGNSYYVDKIALIVYNIKKEMFTNLNEHMIYFVSKWVLSNIPLFISQAWEMNNVDGWRTIKEIV